MADDQSVVPFVGGVPASPPSGPAPSWSYDPGSAANDGGFVGGGWVSGPNQIPQSQNPFPDAIYSGQMQNGMGLNPTTGQWEPLYDLVGSTPGPGAPSGLVLQSNLGQFGRTPQDSFGLSAEQQFYAQQQASDGDKISSLLLDAGIAGVGGLGLGAALGGGAAATGAGGAASAAPAAADPFAFAAGGGFGDAAAVPAAAAGGGLSFPSTLDLGEAGVGGAGSLGTLGGAAPLAALPAAAAAPGVAGGAGGGGAAGGASAAGGGSFIDKLIGSIKNNPLTAAGLGLNVASQLNNNKKSNSLSDQLKATGAPALTAGNDLISQYESGQIPSSTAFDIQKWQDQQIAAARQRYHAMGDSTALANTEAQIRAQAQAMTDTARQGLLTSGLQALQVGQGPIASAAQAQAQQDSALSSSMGSALNSLLLLQALSKGGTTAAAATGG